LCRGRGRVASHHRLRRREHLVVARASDIGGGGRIERGEWMEHHTRRELRPSRWFWAGRGRVSAETK